MVDWPALEATPALKMVEYNTISIGGRALTARTSQLQQYISSKYHDNLKFTYGNDGDQSFFAKDFPQISDNWFF